jgi:hypothetical protein
MNTDFFILTFETDSIGKFVTIGNSSTINLSASPISHRNEPFNDDIIIGTMAPTVMNLINKLSSYEIDGNYLKMYWDNSQNHPENNDSFYYQFRRYEAEPTIFKPYPTYSSGEFELPIASSTDLAGTKWKMEQYVNMLTGEERNIVNAGDSSFALFFSTDSIGICFTSFGNLISIDLSIKPSFIWDNLGSDLPDGLFFREISRDINSYTLDGDTLLLFYDLSGYQFNTKPFYVLCRRIE